MHIPEFPWIKDISQTDPSSLFRCFDSNICTIFSEIGKQFYLHMQQSGLKLEQIWGENWLSCEMVFETALTNLVQERSKRIKDSSQGQRLSFIWN